MFSLDAPESRQAAVAGAFNDWAPQDMARGIDGIWRLTVLLPTGTHAYRFLVDGVWMPDPSNPRRQVNDIGGHDSVCTVM
jgi:1,4-alpha-glucan branching enzyme